MYERVLKFELPENQSAFLWGPRKTGKSTWLKQKYSHSVFYDFLKSDLLIDMIKRPALLREEVIALNENGKINGPIILDEVQKVPELLNEVHWLIENENVNFILCGSSARKLKRNNANLLGGRAWRFELHPLTYKEIPDFDLLKAVNNGLIPSHYLSEYPKRSIKSYVTDYLKEEIREEGLVRNFTAFCRFVDILGFSSGELVNYNNIARETGVDAKTVKEYFNILHDTMLGNTIYPIKTAGKRSEITATPKFYLFDIGVSSYLSGRTIDVDEGAEFGRGFEHFIWMELNSHSVYTEKDYPVHFWRTTTGLEIDFILGNGTIAIEVKGKKNITNKDTKGMRAYLDEYQPEKAILITNESRRRKVGQIDVIPWRIFLEELWDGKII